MSALVADRFERLGVAGVGGMSVVYRARDRATGDIVALKVLQGGDAQDLHRFRDEATLLARLRHTGIVRYVAHGATPEDEAFLAMEWLEGETLAARLRRGRLLEREAVLLAGRVADALAVAHTAGVVHRDIKPGNLFLPGAELGAVKVLDFGIARWAGTRAPPTLSGTVVGTLGYMAPEQARGEAELDARVDVFALGCVLYECLTGARPFVGDNALAVLAKILLDDPVPITARCPGINPSLEALVLRMLARPPEVRPRDGAALTECLAALGTTGRPAVSVSVRPGALTAQERRLVAVLVAARPRALGASADAPTVSLSKKQRTDTESPSVPPATSPPDRQPRALFEPVLAPFGARIEALSDGTVVVALGASGGAAERAAAAARAALALRRAAPGFAVALALGRAESARGPLVGEAIDRAAKLLPARRSSLPPGAPTDPDGGVLVDDAAAGLLAERFVVQDGVLYGEREPETDGPTLLGRPTPFVGRERALATLEGLYAECRNEPRAQVALVTGPAGVGKSRLRREFLSGLAQDTTVWLGRGDPGRTTAFGLLAPCLRRAAGLPPEGTPGDRRDALRRYCEALVGAGEAPRVTVFLGELLGEHFPEAESLPLRSARADPSLLAEQLRLAFESTLDALTARGPLVLALEDLHHADPPSVRLLGAALKRLRERPLLVLALARPELSEAFPALWEGREVHPLPLGPLSPRACERLVRAVLPSTEDPSVLVERAEGNPFFLEELLRAVAEGRGDALPGSVVAVALARLEALAPDARRVLRAASVFGRTFTTEGVSALCGELSAGPWLDELAAREVLARRDAPGGYAFRHAMVREAAYSTLTDEDRALGHRLAGRFLEAQGERDARVLAEHFARGHAVPEAVRCYERAAWQCLDATDLESALVLSRRAVALGAEGETLGSLYLCQMDAHRWRGEFAEVERLAPAATAALGPWTPRWLRASWEGAVAAGRRGDPDGLSVLAEAVLAREGAPGGALEGVLYTLAARAAMHLLFLGRGALAGRLLDALHARRPDLSEDPAAGAMLDHARAMEAHYAQDPEGSLAFTLRASEGFLACGDLRSACIQRVNAGYSHLQFGEHDRAVDTLREALADAEARGIHHAAALARHNLGLGLLRQGRPEEALVMERLAVEACVAQGDRRTEGGSRMYLAQILWSLGDTAGAVREARHAAQVLQGAPPLRAQALATLSLCLSDPRERLEASRQALDTLDTDGAEEGEALVHRAHAEALSANGLTADALTVVARALERIAQRAARFRDPERAARFPTALPDHEALAALARSLAQVTPQPGDRSPS